VDNIFTERLWRTIKYEEVVLSASGRLVRTAMRPASMAIRPTTRPASQARPMSLCAAG